MLDKKDQQILTALQENARISVSDLANTISLSDTPCLRRIKKLEKEHVITGYHASINPKKLELNVLVLSLIHI